MNESRDIQSGVPTQSTPESPEKILADIDASSREAREIYGAASIHARQYVEALEMIAARIERAVRRMEILRQMMRPAEPIAEKADDERLCHGETAIIRALTAEGGHTDFETLRRRTNYAAGTLRTYLPMLRRKGIVCADRLALTAA